MKGAFFLLQYAWKRNKKHVISLFILELVNLLIPFTNIIMPKYIIDELLGGKRVSYLVAFVLTLLFVNLGANLVKNGLTASIFTGKSELFYAFQRDINEKAVLIDYANLETPEYLDSKTQAEKFLYCDGQGFAVLLDKAIGILGKAIFFVGIITIISTLNPIILLVFVALVLLNSYFDSQMKKTNIKINLEKAPYERENEYYSNLFTDQTVGKEIRLNQMNDWLLEKYGTIINQLQSFYKKSVKNQVRSMNITVITTFLQQFVSYGYLVLLVLLGSITVGDFTMYLGAIASFSDAMNDVGESVIDIRRFNQYYEAAELYLNTAPKMRTSGNQPVSLGTHEIIFENVYFRYPGSKINVIADVSFKIHSGEKISMVGENGAGKTTIIKLLVRLYDPTEGTIYLDGKDIKDYDYDSYQSIFSTVFQDFQLFSFSLRENVSLAKDVSDEEVVRALGENGFRERLESLPYGIETQVHKEFHEEGFQPSGGEAQKIALSRALIKDTKVLILDEPASALDPKAESELYERFHEITKGKSAIYVSHRMSSAKFCDTILVVENGRIAENGSHEELFERKGLYYELFEIQSKYYK